MIHLIAIGRETYGHDAQAINRHNVRQFRDERGRLYLLSSTLDGCPPFFEAYGPYTAHTIGLLPRLQVNGRDYWGDGWSWRRALRAFRQAVGAVPPA